jgi:UDP-N-acetylmuramoyl-L-alanyl-D-glutamate--2,6-diaminopimelate ligase
VRPAVPNPVSLAAVVTAVPGLRPLGLTDATVTGVTLDSRAVRRGDLYAALPGARAHGASFAGQAAEAGAVAVLTDPAGQERAEAAGLPVLLADDPRSVLGALSAAVYGDPADALLLLGVTGTNGKTTTAYLLEAGLRAAGHATGLVGTVETRVGDSVVPSVRTTPEAPDLQALLAVMRERGVTAAAMEVSSHALALGRVDGTRFRVAAFTNLTQDHLDFHADMDGYFAAKARLFTPAYAAAGVVCVDDRYGERLAREAGVPVQTASAAGRHADWRAVDVASGPRGSTFRVLGPDGVDLPARVGLPGAYNVANALVAAATLAVAGVPVGFAVSGVGELPGVPGRVERVEAGQAALAVVDYAHTPDAVDTLLATLRPLTPGRLVAVLGCGGDRDRGKRPLMGAAAARGADLAVLTSDNPRSEDPHAILEAVVAGAREVAGAHVLVEVDRRRAVERAVEGLAPGDTLVVAGKGHEQGQEVAGVVRPFDDRLVLAEVLRAAVDRGAAAPVPSAGPAVDEPARPEREAASA